MWNFIKNNTVLSIEMIVMNEEGTKYHSRVFNHNFSRFDDLLKEDQTYIILKPNMAAVNNGFSATGHKQTTTLNWKSILKKCDDFSGPVNGFMFVDFNSIIEQTCPSDAFFGIGQVKSYFDVTKLDAFIKDLRENHIFGKVQAYVYTIEFQKRGSPHSHICLFMHSDNKLPTVEIIDLIISAEIPDRIEEPELYSLVNEFMIHGPRGAENINCPCMVDKKCSKNFPKQFYNHSSVDQNGFPFPSVVRLPFHLTNQHHIVYGEDDDIDDVLDKPSVAASKFTFWMECNAIDSEARELTYVEFSTKFVWILNGRFWKRRKVGKAIGRIHSVSPNLSEAYFLRILLNKVKGPTSFDEIRTVNCEAHSSFRDACYALGLLDDDKEYIDAIKEASHSGSATGGTPPSPPPHPPPTHPPTSPSS
ncbi:unnamed protein product [Lactuca virosa]|uniref:Helitron helicase-like domain-containing protein n=1 Tax=Lactuca virosa TaxID=75947 RepID=A0AAU9PRR1_9ASTR|nr:unnamed protein product [Lactuca virosa]